MNYKLLIFTFLLLIVSEIAHSQNSPLWLRYPAISPDGSTILFSYGGDIYRVPSAGGEAVLLTTGNAHDFMPIWSPDGSKIAFASNRYGNFDVFVMPASGGVAQRLTFYSSGELPTSFSPDGKNVLFSAVIEDLNTNEMFPSGVLSELYFVPVEGGRIKQILSTPAENANFSSDGKLLVYQNRKGYEDQWRKHHTSSIARDILLYNVENKTHTYLTTFNGEDRNPIFSNDNSSIYYLSEKFGSFNICKFSLANPNNVTQLTKFENHPIRFLTISKNNKMCFSYNGEIYTFTEGAEPQKVEIKINTDYRYNEVEYLQISSGATEMAVSPEGKEVAIIIRGEIFVTSVEYGTTKRITNTSEQERSVSFSPDGRSLLYASEKNGSWNIYQTKIVNENEKLFTYSTLLKEEVVYENEKEAFQPSYSPDGKEVAFLEERVELKVINLETKAVRMILSKDYNYSYSDGDQWYEWSPDGKWFIVSFCPSSLFLSDVGLISADGKGQIINLTNSGYGDNYPRWMLGGDAIVWYSDRYGMRSHGSWGAQEDVFAMFLNQEAFVKFNLTKEEAELLELSKKEEDKDNAEEEPETNRRNRNNAADKEDEVVLDTVKIELLDIEDRIKRLTINSSSLSGAFLSPDGKKLFYLSRFEKGFDLWVHDFMEQETKLLLKLDTPYGGIEMDEKGENLFIFSGNQLLKVSVADNKQTPISFTAEFNLNKAQERAYMFEHAWRQVKKKFYDPDLHGVDWDFYKAEYSKFLPHINNNFDFTEMLSEMLGELNGSHTGSGYRYYAPNGDQTAKFAAFFDPNFTGNGLKITEIIDKSPLLFTKQKITAGMIIEKIDGQLIEATKDYFAMLNHKVGKNVLITIFDPKTNKRWDEIVKPISIGAESQLLYERWVKQRRAMTDSLSNGRIGYVHVRGMDSESFRQVFSEVLGRNAEKEAIIIDTRFNGGGWLHDDLAVLFTGKQYVTYSPRNQEFGSDPMSRWTKPSILLVSESNYSDAHAFPYVYKTLEIGKIVGMPVPGTMTAVWWETLQDNSVYFGIPQVGAVDVNGNYLENQQLEPDFMVNNTYETVIKGRDLQLEKAVEVMLKDLDN